MKNFTACALLFITIPIFLYGSEQIPKKYLEEKLKIHPDQEKIEQWEKLGMEYNCSNPVNPSIVVKLVKLTEKLKKDFPEHAKELDENVIRGRGCLPEFVAYLPANYMD